MSIKDEINKMKIRRVVATSPKDKEYQETIDFLTEEMDRYKKLVSMLNPCVEQQSYRANNFERECKSLKEKLSNQNIVIKDLTERNQKKTHKINKLLKTTQSLEKEVSERDSIILKQKIEIERLTKLHQPFLDSRKLNPELMKQKERAFELYKSNTELSIRKLEKLIKTEFNPTNDERIQTISYITIRTYINNKLGRS